MIEKVSGTSCILPHHDRLVAVTIDTAVFYRFFSLITHTHTHTHTHTRSLASHPPSQERNGLVSCLYSTCSAAAKSAAPIQIPYLINGHAQYAQACTNQNQFAVPFLFQSHRFPYANIQTVSLSPSLARLCIAW